jgi:hypothetical protein
MDESLLSPLHNICSDQPGLALELTGLARTGGFVSHRTSGITEAHALILQRVVRPSATLLCASGDLPEDLSRVRALRSADPHLPFVFLSAGGGEGHEAEVRRAGVHCYLNPDAVGRDLPLLLDHLLKRTERRNAAPGGGDEFHDDTPAIA